MRACTCIYAHIKTIAQRKELRRCAAELMPLCASSGVANEADHSLVHTYDVLKRDKIARY